MAKNLKTRIAVALSDKLETIATRFGDLMATGRALQAELGDIAREAATALKGEPDNLQAFVDACRQLCAAYELTDGTVDKTLSQLRGVVRAILTGYKPEDGMSLRAMYEAIPKDATKGGRKPRQTAKGAQDGAGKGGKAEGAQAGGVAPLTPKEAERAAVTVLFGFYSEELAEALRYAAEHAGIFQTWAAASAKAAQSAPAPLRRAA